MFKKTKGFTLLELIIVLAILAIIAIILIPNFFATTDRARLRSDIQSARVIHNAIVLYELERNTNLEGAIDPILERLEDAGFLNASQGDIQSEGATWVLIPGEGVMVNITASPAGVRNAYESLPDTEQRMVITGP